jgi:hypothetical protein
VNGAETGLANHRQSARVWPGFRYPKQGKGDDIGRRSLRHRASPARRTAVGLLDADSVTSFPLVLDNELGVDLFVDLPGGVVGDIENLTKLIAIVVLKGHQPDRHRG